MAQDKILTEEGFREFLIQLKTWLPFIKSLNGGVHFNNSNFDSDTSIFSIGIDDNKCAFEILSDGSIYIIDNEGQRIKLQNALQTTGTGVDMTMSGYNDIIIAGEDTKGDAYDILEDDTIKKAIKKLDKRSESTIIEKDSYLQFPTVGKRNTIYREKSTGKTWIWDTVNKKYIRSSADIIFGGGASDF